MESGVRQRGASGVSGAVGEGIPGNGVGRGGLSDGIERGEMKSWHAPELWIVMTQYSK